MIDSDLLITRDHEAPFTCKYCGMPSWIDPSDQSPPPDYCHEVDHGTEEDRAVFGSCARAGRTKKNPPPKGWVSSQTGGSPDVDGTPIEFVTGCPQ